MSIRPPNRDVLGKMTGGDLRAIKFLEDLAALAGTGGGGGSASWGTISGTLSAQTDLLTALNGKAATVHGHVAANISDLASTVQAYPLDVFADPVAPVEFSQEQALQFVLENRTSDPGSPVTGQIWIRTDL
jgi:hypothetical protein